MEDLKQDIVSVESILYRYKGKSISGRSYTVTAPEDFFEALRGKFYGTGDRIGIEADEVIIRYKENTFTFKKVK